MDFGDILNEWDQIKKKLEESSSSAKKPSRADTLEAWLSDKGVDDKDRDELDPEDRERESRRLFAMKPQAVLDLHGMKAEEAEAAIARFIDGSARSGLEKVLLIHGKGLHSEGGVSVLRNTARRAVEAHPLAGRFGQAAKGDGGSGALWLIIRKRRARG